MKLLLEYDKLSLVQRGFFFEQSCSSKLFFVKIFVVLSLKNIYKVDQIMFWEKTLI